MADTTTLDDLKAIPDVLKALGDIVVATGDLIQKLSDLLPDETRSIIVEVVNLTSRTLTKGADNFDSGGFGPTLPEAQIPPFRSSMFSVKSTGLATGVIGNVRYAAEGAADFNIHFSNPAVGGNTQSVQSNVDDVLSILGDISSGNHTHARFAVLDRNGPFPTVQLGWRSCPKCQGMHFAGGVCPAGGQHDQTGSFAYYLVFNSRPSSHVQEGWRSCPKCQGMHFAGLPTNKGVCPAGGQHDQSGSFEYVAQFGVPEGGGVQLGWRSCPKCQGMHFAGFPTNKGVCPAGGQHDQTGSFEYVATSS